MPARVALGRPRPKRKGKTTMAIRMTEQEARRKLPSAMAALKKNDAERIAEIKRLKREIKKLLRKGEAVYIEHSAANGTMI